MGETPQDMADFVEYVNGPEDSPWGRKRAADGHPKPYGLKYIQLGNEEHVDDNYLQALQADGRGDVGQRPQHHPRRRRLLLRPADHRSLQVPRRRREHSGGPQEDPRTGQAAQPRGLVRRSHRHRQRRAIGRAWAACPRFIKALGQICPGAKYKVVIFELNAGCHNVGRALGNARAINEFQRLGSVPIVCSANCLQPYRQNDNGWNQGLLFLSPSQVWSQPPGYVAQMLSRWRLPQCVAGRDEEPQQFARRDGRSQRRTARRSSFRSSISKASRLHDDPATRWLSRPQPNRQGRHAQPAPSTT